MTRRRALADRVALLEARSCHRDGIDSRGRPLYFGAILIDLGDGPPIIAPCFDGQGRRVLTDAELVALSAGEMRDWHPSMDSETAS